MHEACCISIDCERMIAHGTCVLAKGNPISSSCAAELWYADALLAWMGVGCVKPSAVQAFSSGRDSCSSWKPLALYLVPSGVLAKKAASPAGLGPARCRQGSA